MIYKNLLSKVARAINPAYDRRMAHQEKARLNLYTEEPRIEIDLPEVRTADIREARDYKPMNLSRIAIDVAGTRRSNNLIGLL